VRPHSWRAACGAVLLWLVVAVAPPALAASADQADPASCPSGQSGGFVAGQLVQVSSTQLALRTASSCSTPVVIGIAPTTQICVRSCGAAWQDLRIGDQLAVGLLPALTNPLLARWVDADGVAGYGTVTAVQGDSVTIVLTRGYPGSVRTLHIQPSTSVADAGGRTVVGQVGSLQVGNDVYFTGATDAPGPQDTNIWTYRVLQLGKPTATPRLPATGAGGLGAGAACPGLAALLMLAILGAAWLPRPRLPWAPR
jgi:hypothetical protein